MFWGKKMEKIDARRALELLIDVVDQYGEDAVYERVPAVLGTGSMNCQYQHNGQPSCIVGHVLARAGVPISVLYKLDEVGVPADRLRSFLPDVEGPATQVLNEAQSVQDSGKSWGQALTAARTRYEALVEQGDV